MANVVLVTGTDTGVGKTVVAAGLARALVRAGARVLAVKPVETGCDDSTRGREDGNLLAAATGQAQPIEALIRLRDPLTPALAADRELRSIDFDALMAELSRLAQDADVLLVEGAGGLRSPITWTEDWIDVARRLEARALVVGAARLGVLGHVQLTGDALYAGAIVPLGVVLSAPERGDASTGTNVDALRRRLAPHRLEDRILAFPRIAGVDGAAEHASPLVAWALGEVDRRRGVVPSAT